MFPPNGLCFTSDGNNSDVPWIQRSRAARGDRPSSLRAWEYRFKATRRKRKGGRYFSRRRTWIVDQSQQGYQQPARHAYSGSGMRGAPQHPFLLPNPGPKDTAQFVWSGVHRARWEAAKFEKCRVGKLKEALTVACAASVCEDPRATSAESYEFARGDSRFDGILKNPCE